MTDDTTTDHTHDDDIRKVAELAKGIRDCMLTTVDEHGHLTSRPMALQEAEFDGSFWFIIETNSRKAGHIAADPHVALTLTSNSTWLSIDGHAAVVDDQARLEEYWNPWAEAWMPEGPKDRSAGLLRVDAHTAQYWDTPGGTVASVISLVKAKVTGKPYEGVDEGVVELDR